MLQQFKCWSVVLHRGIGSVAFHRGNLGLTLEWGLGLVLLLSLLSALLVCITIWQARLALVMLLVSLLWGKVGMSVIPRLLSQELPLLLFYVMTFTFN